MSAKRIAVVSTHPIQYHSAWFQSLAAQPELDVHVYYCHRATPLEQARAGFGVEFDWDVPLLSGYPHCFLRNVADPPGPEGLPGLILPKSTTSSAVGNMTQSSSTGGTTKALGRQFGLVGNQKSRS